MPEGLCPGGVCPGGQQGHQAERHIRQQPLHSCCISGIYTLSLALSLALVMTLGLVSNLIMMLSEF